MASKKRGKKSSSRKSQKRKVKTSSISQSKIVSKKIKLTLTSLVFSLIIFAGSWLGYEYFILDTGFFGNFFFILSYISGFLSVAFFIALLVFLVLKAFKK